MDTGDIVDAKIFFGEEKDTLKKIKESSFIGYLKMNIVNPPEGTTWGYFNDRPVNQAWVSGLAEMFVNDKLHNCEERYAMDIAVNRSWVNNLVDAESIRELSGKDLQHMPQLQLTTEGQRAILEDGLWVMGGNHRRLALISYVDWLKYELNILEGKILAEDVLMGRSTRDAAHTSATDPAIGSSTGGVPNVAHTASTSAIAPMTQLQIRARHLKAQMEDSPMWVVRLYDRGAPIIVMPIHLFTNDPSIYYLSSEKVESHGVDKSYATFRYMSRNENLGFYKATDEEYLLEIVDQLKIALMKDLRALPNREFNFDFQMSCPTYMEAVEAMASKYKSVNSGFRKLALVPSFMLGLVMASRVRKHFVHARWFKASNLLKMLDVHGGVSCQPAQPCEAFSPSDPEADEIAHTQLHPVPRRVAHTGHRDAGEDGEPGAANNVRRPDHTTPQ